MRSEDIAKLAGVSRSTVSRVINNYPNVPEETRLKVQRVIEQYQYEPNTSARVLAGKGIDTIGLFIVSTAEQHNVNRIYDNSYFARFVDAVVDTANANGSYVLIHTVYTASDFQKIKQAFLQKRIDGGILVGMEQAPELVRELAALEAPLVLIDYDIAEIIEHRLDKNHLTVINSKDYEGAAAAVRHLIQLGHRDMGFLSGRLNTFSGRERRKAFEDTLKEAGLPLHNEFMLKGEFLKMTAYDEVKRMLQYGGPLPTAIFSANDDMAIAALPAIADYNLKIPDDIALAGFDDVPAASLLSPGLTTVRLPIYEMSKAAVESILHKRQQNGGYSSFGTISFPTELVVRGSSGGPLY